MSRVSHKIDRLEPVFDDESLVADAGLLTASTLMDRLGLEDVVDSMVRLGGPCGRRPAGPQGIDAWSASMLLGGSHIDHTDRLRAGSTRGGVAVPADGFLNGGDFSAVFDLGSCPSTGQSPDRGAAAGMDGGRRPRRRDAGDD